MNAPDKPARLVTRTSEDIKNKKWSEKEKESLRQIAERQVARDDSQIDFSDIPHLTDEQWAGMVPLRDMRKVRFRSASKKK
jgi:hypothetical protein